MVSHSWPMTSRVLSVRVPMHLWNGSVLQCSYCLVQPVMVLEAWLIRYLLVLISMGTTSPSQKVYITSFNLLTIILRLVLTNLYYTICSWLINESIWSKLSWINLGTVIGDFNRPWVCCIQISHFGESRRTEEAFFVLFQYYWISESCQFIWNEPILDLVSTFGLHMLYALTDSSYYLDCREE